MTIRVFGLGFGEILIILVLALILLGPQRLPDAAKQLGRALRDFKKTTDDLKQQFEGELYDTSRPKGRPPSTAPADASPAPPPALGPAPAATAENVPGLEAALAEPAPVAAGAPADAPGEKGT